MRIFQSNKCLTNLFQTIESVKSFFFFPYVNLFVLAFRIEAAIIAMQQMMFTINYDIEIWIIIAIRQSQNGQDRHLLALYMLIRPTSCKMQPSRLRRGTAKVKGIEKEDKIEVIVEIQIELQAPPEQIVKGVEREDKMLRITVFTTDGESDF